MRDELIESFESAISRVDHGEAFRMVLVGEIGMGKSWLLDQFASRVPEEWRILRAAGHPLDDSTPLGAVHQLLWPVLDRFGGSENFTNISLLDAITSLAEERPLVVLVDDLHWLDPASVEEIIFSARRTDADRVLTVLASRPHEWPEGWSNGFTRFDLAPLAENQSLGILAERAPDLVDETADRLVALAEGVPLGLVEGLAALSARQRAGLEALPASLPLGPRMTEYFAPRFRSLDRSTRELALAAALERMDLSMLGQVATHLGTSIDALSTAEENGLLRVTDTGVEFAHPMAISAVRASCTRSGEQHARKAIVANLPDDSHRVAIHLDWLTEGPDDELSERLARAAEQAWERHAFNTSGQLWWRAAERATTETGRTAFRRRSVRAYMYGRRSFSFAELIKELADKATNIEDEAHWHTELMHIGGYLVDEIPHERLMDLAGRLVSAGHRAIPLLRALAIMHLAKDDTARASEVIEFARSLSEEASAADQLGLDSIAIVMSEPIYGSFLQPGWIQAFTDDDLLDPTFPAVPALTLLSWAGYAASVAPLVDRLVEVLERERRYNDLSMALTQLALKQQYQGRLHEALTSYSRAIELARSSDYPLAFPHMLEMTSMLLWMMGEPKLARTELDEVPESALGNVGYTRQMWHLATARLHLSEGSAEKAMRSLEHAEDLEIECGSPSPLISPRFNDQMLIYAFTDERKLARDCLARFEARLATTHHAAMPGYIHRARAFVADDPQEQDRLFGEALAVEVPAGNAVGMIRTKMVWARVLRKRKERRRARELLHEARADATACGALAMVPYIDDELVSCGERREQSAELPKHVQGVLTPREYQIATLAAEGLSNPEVAARLFLSRRTIEFHLSNILRKLKIDSRRELTQALAPQPPER